MRWKLISRRRILLSIRWRDNATWNTVCACWRCLLQQHRGQLHRTRRCPLTVTISCHQRKDGTFFAPWEANGRTALDQIDEDIWRQLHKTWDPKANTHGGTTGRSSEVHCSREISLMMAAHKAEKRNKSNKQASFAGNEIKRRPLARCAVGRQQWLWY